MQRSLYKTLSKETILRLSCHVKDNTKQQEKVPSVRMINFFKEGVRERVQRDLVGRSGAFVLLCKRRRKTVVSWHTDSYKGSHMVSLSLSLTHTYGYKCTNTHTRAHSYKHINPSAKCPRPFHAPRLTKKNHSSKARFTNSSSTRALDKITS